MSEASSRRSSNQRPVRFAILGTGSIVRRYVAAAITAAPGATLQAIASRTPAAAEALAQGYGAIGLDGYQAALDSPEIDALYIALPNTLHAQWTLKAVQARKHVITEKPAVLEAGEAKTIAAAATAARKRWMEAFVFPFHPQHLWMLKQVQAGALGQLKHIQSAFGFPPMESDNIRYQKALGGGARYDLGCYSLAAARFYFGTEPTAVTATLRTPPEQEVDCSGAIQLEFPNGQTAHGIFGFDMAYQNSLQLWGTQGRLISDRAFSIPPDEVPSLRQIDASGQSKAVSIGSANQFEKMIQFFCEKVQTGDGQTQMEQGAVAQAHLMDAVRQSALTGQRVELSNPE